MKAKIKYLYTLQKCGQDIVEKDWGAYHAPNYVESSPTT